METTFKYKNTIISTPNLEKKLKRMRITLNDIEIVDASIKKEEPLEESDLEKVEITDGTYYYVSFLPKGYRPSIKELVKKDMWNPDTKTGIKEFTEEYINKLYYV